MNLPPEFVAELKRHLGERVTCDADVLEEHGHDTSSHDGRPPDVVVFPESTDEVVAVVWQDDRDSFFVPLPDIYISSSFDQVFHERRKLQAISPGTIWIEAGWRHSWHRIYFKQIDLAVCDDEISP